MSPVDRLAEAEAEKVTLEIEQLRKPVYRRVPFWTGIVIPLVVLTASLVTGEVTGFFDEQLRELEQQKIDLQEQLNLAESTAQAVMANNMRRSSRCSIAFASTCIVSGQPESISTTSAECCAG